MTKRAPEIHLLSEADNHRFSFEHDSSSIDPFTKRHKLVHYGRFPKIEALYCS